LEAVRAKGLTGHCRVRIFTRINNEGSQGSLSSPKNSVSRTSFAILICFIFGFLPYVPKLVSVSFCAITTIGIGVAVLAVLCLYTSVLINENEATSAGGLASRDCVFYAAGDVVAEWEMIALVWRERAAKAEEKASMVPEADEEELDRRDWAQVIGL
jgi:hypothetical protein